MTEQWDATSRGDQAGEEEDRARTSRGAGVIIVMEPSSVAEGEVVIQGVAAARDTAAAVANGGRREAEGEEDCEGVFVQRGEMVACCPGKEGALRGFPGSSREQMTTSEFSRHPHLLLSGLSAIGLLLLELTKT